MATPDYLEWTALMRAVCAAPEDDTPRLVAADWLEEHGDPKRASFVRVQVRLAQLDASGLGQSTEAKLLQYEEKRLLSPLEIDALMWAAHDCPELVDLVGSNGRTGLEGMKVDGADRLIYRRGFVEQINCPAVSWLHHGRAIRERQPVRDLVLTGCGQLTRDRWVTMVHALGGLRRLILDEDPNRLVEWLRSHLPGT